MTSLPSNHEAEQGVLCCLLNDIRLIPVALDKLTSDCFLHYQTQLVFDTIAHLHKRFIPIEVPTLISHMRDNDLLEKVGGSAAISELYTYLPIPSQFGHYVEELLEKYALRQIVTAAINIVEQTRDGDQKSAGIMDHAVSEFTRLSMCTLNTADMLPCRKMSDVINDVIDSADQRAKTQDTLPGLSTGFPTIDRHTGGMQAGRLWVIAGETSDGKSTLCQNMVEEACESGGSAVFYSYEMPDTECAERLICSRGRVDNFELMSGKLSQAGQIGMARAVSDMSKWDLSLLDVSDATIEQICRDITLRRNAQKKLNPKARMVACIDYLQLANTKEKFGDNRERAVAHISKTAKQCAKQNGVTILMPSQLNDDGKLRESRAIAHDADVLLLIRKVKPENKHQKVDELSDLRQIFCPKNRGGKRNWHFDVRLNGANFQFITQ
jgi:replicative DNA helicase